MVRTVATSDFRAQLDLLAELGDIVPLSALETGGSRDRPRFALTFDDDDVNHVQHALPILQERQLPATFFLSGRWLHGYGPYWWEVLEERIRLQGPRAVAAGLGLDPELTPEQIGSAITGRRAARELAELGRGAEAAGMDGADAAQLVAAGMEIGFHTVDHPPLTALDDEELTRALDEGRTALSEELSTPLARFAYPHGRADERVANAAADAGFRSAWTTAKVVNLPHAEPLLRGRWDVGHLPIGQIRARLVRALARPGR